MRNPEPGFLAKARDSVVGLPASVTASNHPPRILIIEDEALISLMIADMVQELGYAVSGVANTMAIASREFAKRNYDAVLLDINIGGRYHAETADHLLGWGIPFAFVTGYDYLVDPRHEKIPVLPKPFEPAHLRALLEELVGPASSVSELAQAG
ncbi:MAG: response regulator [Pseudolabrys sp.]